MTVHITVKSYKTDFEKIKGLADNLPAECRKEAYQLWKDVNELGDMVFSSKDRSAERTSLLREISMLGKNLFHRHLEGTSTPAPDKELLMCKDVN